LKEGIIWRIGDGDRIDIFWKENAQIILDINKHDRMPGGFSAVMRRMDAET
jgi:hypothetical protein